MRVEEHASNLRARGWCRLGHDCDLATWVAASLPAARRAVAAPEHSQWLRCGGTWFAGVNALGNDATGKVPGGVPLPSQLVDTVRGLCGLDTIAWDRAQVSVCYPGYPRQGDEETDAAFGYRLRRDAAHVDGLVREGPDKRRHLREPHAFILGIPMSTTTAGAAPLVVWEGSHEIMRRAFRTAFAGLAPKLWGEEDITEIYHAARREVFAQCPRVVVHAIPGEAYVVHRLALHGVSTWLDGAEAGPDGRMIAYFRPELPDQGRWLADP